MSSGCVLVFVCAFTPHRFSIFHSFIFLCTVKISWISADVLDHSSLSLSSVWSQDIPLLSEKALNIRATSSVQKDTVLVFSGWRAEHFPQDLSGTKNGAKREWYIASGDRDTSIMHLRYYSLNTKCMISQTSLVSRQVFSVFCFCSC